ncbi:MAG: S9 family peptidase [Planctomycetes bacterium]|nr:S9 family peptidase [Planctomycetota bacterium]
MLPLRLAIPLLSCCLPLLAQAPAAWQRPPEVIAQLVETPPPPDVGLSPRRSWLVLTTREALPTIEVLARPHQKLAGLRIDPALHGRQLGTRVTSLRLRSLADGSERAVPIPIGHWSGPFWSADDRAFALVRAAEGGAELWLADPATAPPRRIDGVRLNTVLGGGVQWLPDQRRLLVRLVVEGEAPTRPAAPAGPQVQEVRGGTKAQVRTYQDLLQDAHDERLFEHFATCQPAVVDPAGDRVVRLGSTGLVVRDEPSPDGAWLLVERLQRPFSYAVPYPMFPRTVELRSLTTGATVREVAQLPLQDTVPIGGVPTGPRSIDWVPVLPDTLVFCEALDGGDPRNEVEHRDLVWRAAAAGGEPQPWFRLRHRFAGLGFADDGRTVLVTEFDRRTRRQWVHRGDAVDAARPLALLYERSTQDAYGDPGRPVREVAANGAVLLRLREGRLLLVGAGASPDGERPFVDEWTLESGAKQRWFEAAAGRYETFVGLADEAGRQLLLRSESPTEPPSLVVLDRASGARTTLLAFPDPAAERTRGVEKRLLRYRREDGVELSGTLYLPPGHRDGQRHPTLIWAYPLEYTQASDAGQVRAAPNRWLRLQGSSHLFLLLHGYAVFDDAAMPIVGPQRTANDTFVLQVQQNARAAVAALEATGAVDPQRLAVAGHSYGAFMTANLLAHTDLFAAGIARSGAYNRTLTPFGFQSEDRTFWEAPEVYHAMSPFAHADRIRRPLLLIHGADDDNSGTFPLQSQRLFAAIQGHGGTARLCLLPHEAHGYRSREGVLQCLAEMCDWLDRHLAPPRAETR